MAAAAADQPDDQPAWTLPHRHLARQTTASHAAIQPCIPFQIRPAHLAGLMSTTLKAASGRSRCQRLIRRSSALTKLSWSLLSAMLLMWYVCALAYARRQRVASTVSVDTMRGRRNCARPPPLPAAPNAALSGDRLLLLGGGPRPLFSALLPLPRLNSERQASRFSKTWQATVKG